MNDPTSAPAFDSATGHAEEQRPRSAAGGDLGRRGSAPLSRPILLASAACAAIFVVLAILAQLHALRALDLRVAVSVHAMDVPPFQRASTIVATLLAFEASTVYAIVGAIVLWRAGAGRWSLAPFAFFGLTALEIVLKVTLDQPGVPLELQRLAPYPFNVVTLDGSFPSGHAMRSAFLCVFVAVLVWPRGHHMATIAPPQEGRRLSGPPPSSGTAVLRQVVAVALVLLSVPLGLTRVYMGYHWLSDVIAGLVLGGGTALFVATQVAERLDRRSTQPTLGWPVNR